MIYLEFLASMLDEMDIITERFASISIMNVVS